MKRFFLALLIILSGMLTSCIKNTRMLSMDILLKPGVGMRKDIGIAD